MKKLMMMTAALAAAMLAGGCAVVSGRAGESSYTGLAFGDKASATLAGLNVTETVRDGAAERGVGVDAAGSASETRLMETLGKIFLAGLSAYTGQPAEKPAAPADGGDCPEGECEE